MFVLVPRKRYLVQAGSKRLLRCVQSKRRCRHHRRRRRHEQPLQTSKHHTAALPDLCSVAPTSGCLPKWGGAQGLLLQDHALLSSVVLESIFLREPRSSKKSNRPPFVFRFLPTPTIRRDPGSHNSKHTQLTTPFFRCSSHLANPLNRNPSARALKLTETDFDVTLCSTAYPPRPA